MRHPKHPFCRSKGVISRFGQEARPRVPSNSDKIVSSENRRVPIHDLGDVPAATLTGLTGEDVELVRDKPLGSDVVDSRLLAVC